MLNAVADDLARTIEQASDELRAIDEATAASKPASGAWSIKEILGHLVDSAANNHHRFVRAQQVEAFSFPGYEQEAWVRAQGYQHEPWTDLIELWRAYNRHLVHVMRRIPEPATSVPCRIGSGEAVSLGFIAEDYVVHLRHHLTQIRDRRAGDEARRVHRRWDVAES